MSKACFLGYNVTNTKGYNNRIFVRKRVENLQKKAKTIVLGSSRAMKIGSDILQTKKVQNIGVSSGVLQDILGLYGVYSFNFNHPKHVYIVMDPWFLMDKKRDNRWLKSYKAEATKMQALINGKEGVQFELVDRSEKVFPIELSDVYSISEFHFKDEDIEGLKATEEIFNEFIQTKKRFEELEGKELTANELIKLPFLYDSLNTDDELYLNETAERLVEETAGYRQGKFDELEFYEQLNIVKLNRVILELTYGLKEKEKCDEIVTRKSISTELTRLPDGTINYKPNYEKSTVGQINKRAKKRGATPFMMVANEKFSNQKKFKATFEKFIEYLKDNNVKVSLVMVPFHPIVSKQLKDVKFGFAKEVEQYLRAYGKDHKLKVIGGYYPEEFSITEEDFYDDIHIRKSGLKKLEFK